MVSSNTKNTLLDVLKGGGSLTGIIGIYWYLYYANMLNPLIEIIYFDYSLAQIIFMVLIAIDIAVSLYPVFTHEKSLSQARSDIEQILRETTGASENQIKHAEDQMITDAKSAVKSRLGLSMKRKKSRKSKISKNSRTSESSVMTITAVSPDSIRSDFNTVRKQLLSQIAAMRTPLLTVQQQSGSLMRVNAVTSETEIEINSTTAELGEIIEILPVTSINVKKIEMLKSYKKRKWIFIGIIAGICAILYLVYYLTGVSA